MHSPWVVTELKTKNFRMSPGAATSVRTKIASAATFTLTAIIAALTLMPMPQGGLPESDKLYHILAFTALAVPLSVAFTARALRIFIGVTTYGNAIELIQPTFHRMGEWGDLGADAIGAALGALTGVMVGVMVSRSR